MVVLVRGVHIILQEGALANSVIWVKLRLQIIHVANWVHHVGVVATMARLHFMADLLGKITCTVALAVWERSRVLAKVRRTARGTGKLGTPLIPLLLHILRHLTA